MLYLQLTEDQLPHREVMSGENIEWDEQHLCPVSALTEEEIELFRIVPLEEIAAPPFNVRTQHCFRDGAEYVNDKWQFKWVVQDKSQEEKDLLLAELKIQKNNYINNCRYETNFTSFEFQNKQVACDQLSRSDIESTNSQIIKHQALPTGWPGGWKAQDNTYVPITSVNEWNQFYDAMYETGMANFLKSQNLKLQLSTATLENIDSIVW